MAEKVKGVEIDQVREKLMELLTDNVCKHEYCEDCEYYKNEGGCVSFLKDKMADHLIDNGVTVLSVDEQRNVYTVKEIEEIQGEAYDLGVESVLHNHFGLSWHDAEKVRKEVAQLRYAQKWIPVTERLPEIPDGWAENPEPVLYMMKNTKNIYAGYYGEGGVWRDKYFRQYADSRNGVDADDVLCWMWQHDLPEPPKDNTSISPTGNADKTKEEKQQ